MKKSIFEAEEKQLFSPEAAVPIPRFFRLRRVPLQYSSVLPMSIMRKYQCIVVGRARNSLTVAITHPKCLCAFSAISQLTGCQVFPVLIDAITLHLLLRRIERAEYERNYRYTYRRHALSLDGACFPSLHTMIQFLTSPSQKLYQRH